MNDGRAMTTRNSERPRTLDRKAWLSTLMLLLPCLLCGVVPRVMAQDVPHGAGAAGPGQSRTGTPAAHIGSIMALLATFHEAGVLPPESSREADRLIHALIQSQSMFLNSADPVVRKVLSSALSGKFNAKKTASLTQAFDSQGWTSETLEALVDYAAQRSPADEAPLAESFHDYNVSPPDWKFVGQVFAKARERFLKQGKQIHTAFAAHRAVMPGARP